MNSNDLLAQQQALLNQLEHQQHQIVWGVIALQILFLIVTAWVLYMFYCRLRDISIEIKNFRLAYESLNSSRTKSSPSQRPELPPSASTDARFMPRA